MASIVVFVHRETDVDPRDTTPLGLIILLGGARTQGSPTFVEQPWALVRNPLGIGIAIRLVSNADVIPLGLGWRFDWFPNADLIPLGSVRHFQPQRGCGPKPRVAAKGATLGNRASINHINPNGVVDYLHDYSQTYFSSHAMPCFCNRLRYSS